MIIRGILDSSLNGQLCIRGFAPIKELARISTANYKYQRKPLAEQEETIRYFLDTEPYLFFPEIILSLKIKHSFTDKKNSATPLSQIQSGKTYRSSVDRTILQVKSIDYKLSNDSTGKSKVSIVEIAMNDEVLNDLIAKKLQPFQRIDGNHRLKAAELTTTEKVNRMVAPFCIILGEEFYENNNPVNHQNTYDFEKSIMIYFHNINTKTLPLTSEENLRVIISDENEIKFTDDELESILGHQGVVTRNILKESGYLKVYPKLIKLLQGQKRTWLLNAISTVIHNKIVRKTALKRVILNALAQINSIANQNDELIINESVFVALVYFYSQSNKAKSELFPNWLNVTGNGNIRNITAENLIAIFNDYTDKTINCFVAMPFFGVKEMRAYNKTYNSVIEKILKVNPTLKLNLFPIMLHKGKSFDLLQHLLACIDKSDVVIIDITNSDPNVIYELGYAKRAEKHRIIVCEESYFKKVPFDFEHDLRRSYSKTALTELEDKVYIDLVAILKQEYHLIIN